MNQPSIDFPFRLESPAGLSIQVNGNGSIRRMDVCDILLNLYLGTEIEGGPGNLYLRHHGRSIESIPLIGPCSPAAFEWDRQTMTANGNWRGIRFRVSLILARSSPAWFWQVVLENTGTRAETVDLIYTQDLALAHYGAVRLNEYYVCHYLDHTPLSHPERGFVVASRQNLSMGGKNPWTIIGSLGKSVSYATDALQFHGLSTRAGLPPIGWSEGLPGTRFQHEHSMVAIQDGRVDLQPNGVTERGFFGWFEADHPAESSAADLQFVDRTMGLPEAAPAPSRRIISAAKPARSLFSDGPVLNGLDLTEGEITDLFGEERREEERVDGRLLSFFTGLQRHVVLKAKELKVLRPHAQMLRTGSRLIPDEASLTSTTWMGGVFHSMITQGHVSINRFLSTAHSYLGLLRENGQRLFVEIHGRWHLLNVPSAYEMSPQACRWIYKHEDGLIRITSTAMIDAHELNLLIEVLSGSPARFLLSNHIALNGDDGSEPMPARILPDAEGISIKAPPDSDVGRRFPNGGFRVEPLTGTILEKIGGDELLFTDSLSRKQPFLCMATAPGTSAGFRMKGELVIKDIPKGCGPEEEGFREMIDRLRFHPPPGSRWATAAARVGEILPWFVHDALIHYLAPRGIEQYTGGGWGTRDICQGAVEMMLGLGRFEPVKDILTRVFKTQNPDGDWPQWFMFFDRERNIRPPDSHGDIVFWPVLALAQYLIASEDRAFLDEQVVFFHPDGDQKAERGSLWNHVERALEVIGSRVIPTTRLAAYGNGDWNDSLQPVQPEMRERLCSTWTVTLHYQTLLALGKALNRVGLQEPGARCDAMAAEVREDFERILLVDGVLTGFAYFQEDARVDYLLHPRDGRTGLSYSLLPMIHAIINHLLSPPDADRHLGLIRKHLLGPDGARLFDRPMEYRGGPQRLFQRAESGSFFGREIGLMYTHAHLRYAEALAQYGDAEAFFTALCQANPIGIRELVPAATLRQSNCYYSSSDAAFADRYQASAEYGRLMKGEIPLDGGWRVYSSGAGIWTSLVLQCFLGIRRQKSALVLDPVIPRALDGMRVEMELGGFPVEVVYRIRTKGCGPIAVNLNGSDLPFSRSANPYRVGPAEIPMSAVNERLRESINRMDVVLG